jgi:hypothetical protein
MAKLGVWPFLFATVLADARETRLLNVCQSCESVVLPHAPTGRIRLRAGGD